MAPNTEMVGRSYPPVVYAVGREKIREYAQAVGERDPRHLDLAAARAAGYADVVAPPMFAVVYAGAAILGALHDPAVGIDYAHLVHGAQEFRWGTLVVAGDEVTTRARIADVSDRRGLYFYVFETESVNQLGERVCDGVWTNIVRAAEVTGA